MKNIWPSQWSVVEPNDSLVRVSHGTVAALADESMYRYMRTHRVRNWVSARYRPTATLKIAMPQSSTSCTLFMLQVASALLIVVANGRNAMLRQTAQAWKPWMHHGQQDVTQESVVSVTTYGAKGDGIHNDAPNFQVCATCDSIL